MVVARRHLELSHLDEQEALRNDIQLEQFRLVVFGDPSIELKQRIVSGEVTRSIEGASTLAVGINDYDRLLLKSGRLAKDVDVKIDGLWFRLAQVTKNADLLDLTFEDREAAVLRSYSNPRKAEWGKMTRTQFVKNMMLDAVKEFDIPFIAPGYKDINTGTSPQATATKAADRVPGFSDPFGAGLTVKGAPATPEQTTNMALVIQAGLDKLMPRALLVCAIMTIAVESSAINIPGGDRDSVGLFQQRASWGTFEERMDPKTAAGKFYDAALRVYNTEPNAPLWQICADTQRPAEQYRTRYASWEAEASKAVDSYGVPGSDVYNPTIQAEQNNQQTEPVGANPLEAGLADYEFTCGTPTQTADGKVTWKREDYWTCIGRLADEVAWRRFLVSGALYFIDEPTLFRSQPRMRVTEFQNGVDFIDFDYDEGKDLGTVTVNCRIHRWVAPPGTVILLSNMGLIDGRWLVSEIRRPLFDTTATITAVKPRPKLPEPSQPQAQGYNLPGETPTTGTPPGTKADLRKAIVAVAKRLYELRNDYTYANVRPFPTDPFSFAAHHSLDCSAFCIDCYLVAEAPDPGGGNGTGYGNTASIEAGFPNVRDDQARLGDIALYGSARGETSHAAIYDGAGYIYSFGHTPIEFQPVRYRSDFLGFINALGD